jgi:hypothetical protein
LGRVSDVGLLCRAEFCGGGGGPDEAACRGFTGWGAVRRGLGEWEFAVEKQIPPLRCGITTKKAGVPKQGFMGSRGLNGGGGGLGGRL